MERQKLGNSMPRKIPFNGPKTNLNRKGMQPVASQKRSICREQPFIHFDAIPDNSSSLNCPQGASNPVLGHARFDDGTVGFNFLGTNKRVKHCLDNKSKKQLRNLRSKLETELNTVRNLVKRIEHYSGSNVKSPVNGFGGTHSGKLKRVRSEVGSVDFSDSRADQLVSPGVEYSQGVNSNFSKETRKQKKNGFYQSPDLSPGKDSVMSSEYKNNSKTNGKKCGERRGGAGYTFGMGNPSSKVVKSCNALLDKLMKHKSGWIFSSPVDVEGLGLHDYYTIIKHPMDLGTVKLRLNSNWYKTIEDFAEDVRLTFHNAIRYNPQGHDVNTFARQFLKMFEDKWVALVADYSQETDVSSDFLEVPLNSSGFQDFLPNSSGFQEVLPNSSGFQEVMPIQVMRRALTPASPIQFSADKTVVMDTVETVMDPVDLEPKITNSVQSGRSRVPKKPKARDPHKRDMTYEEKQKLSLCLQDLPSEKLETVLQIIKKRNPHLCQNDEEIEVDIDSVDTETLWELDRLVINYKKNLSKIKRSAEMAQSGLGAEPNTEEENEAHSAMEEHIEIKSDDKNVFVSSPVSAQGQGEGEGHSASVSKGSSSSSSDSASSSSDSDTDSSSS